MLGHHFDGSDLLIIEICSNMWCILCDNKKKVEEGWTFSTLRRREMVQEDTGMVPLGNENEERKT